MFYLKNTRDSMSTIFTPIYATLTIGYHEIKLYTITKKNALYYSLTILKRTGKELKQFFNLFKIKLDKTK